MIKDFLKNYMPLIFNLINLLLFWWSFPFGGIIYAILSILGVTYTDCKLKKINLIVSIALVIMCVLNWDLKIAMWLRYR